MEQRTFATASAGKFHDVVIVSVARTPVGTMQGGLASLSAPKLGAIALKAAIERAGIQPGDVEELYLGNVVSANLGQAPARQALIAAGSPQHLQTISFNQSFDAHTSSCIHTSSLMLNNDLAFFLCDILQESPTRPSARPSTRSARLG